MEEFPTTIPLTILMVHQHDTDRHGITRVIPPVPRSRRKWFPSARRRRNTYPFLFSRKRAVSMFRLRLTDVSNDNSKGKSSRFKIKSSRLSLRSRITRHVSYVTYSLAFRLKSLVTPSVAPSSASMSTNQKTSPTSYSHSLRPSYLNSPAIVRALPRLSSPFRFPITTMTPSVSTGFQVPCFLPEDPPYLMKSTPSPSTVSTLPLLNQMPPLHTSTPPLIQ